MKKPRTIPVLHWVVVFAMAVSWLVVSNHCALGLATVAEKSRGPHSCCHPEMPKPGNPLPGPENGMTCCKALHALPGHNGPGLAATQVTFVDFSFAWVTAGETAGPVPQPSWPADTGPPRGASFSELVLHRSLRSHAPPLLA